MYITVHSSAVQFTAAVQFTEVYCSYIMYTDTVMKKSEVKY